jgi:two-component system phosphate regulon response regulator PhoB
MADLAPEPAGKDTRVLIAEDDDALRRLLELRLHMDGFSVATAADGQQAIDQATTQDPPPDILLCDIMMPRVSGLNVCRELRARAGTREMPIILLSAHNLDSTIEAVMALGNIDFMNKPFDACELRERILSVLAQHAGAVVA